jgi:hypothetical protein
MRFFLLLCCSLVAAPALWADAAVQTDWQGGPGIPGPVTSWGDRFDVATDLDWDTTPGQLKLIIETGINLVATGFDGASCAFPVDFDNDGDMDIVGVGRWENSIAWWENLGGGEAWAEHIIGSVSTPMFVVAGDFDLDGDRDVIVSSAGTTQIIYWENTGGGDSWLSHVLEADFDGREIRAADFDGDGDLDLVGVSSNTGDVCWWKNRLNQGLPWVKTYIDGALIGAYACSTADLDGDGDVDVIASSYSQDKVILYRNDLQFTGSWLKETLASSVGGPVSVAIANLDADPLLEVAVACWSASDIATYDYSTTLMAWHRTNVENNLSGAISVTTGDMNNDGIIDIIACGSGDSDVVWYQNDGTGDNWAKSTVDSNFGGASSVAIADMDDDGVNDIIATASNADQVAWWRVAGFSTPGVLQSSIIDLGSTNVYWQNLFWSLDQPSLTQISFNVRCSNNPANMGPWSPNLTVSGVSLVGVLQNQCRYFQYLVTLCTTHPYSTPSLKDVTVLWSTWFGIEDGEGGPASVLEIASPNPSYGAFTVQWVLEEPGNATLSVFDATGRIVRELATGWYDAGVRDAVVDGLPAGVYAVSLQGDGISALRRVVVLP